MCTTMCTTVRPTIDDVFTTCTTTDELCINTDAIYSTTITTCTTITGATITTVTTTTDDRSILQFRSQISSNEDNNWCALYSYLLPILYYNIQYFIGCDNINTTICDNNNSHSPAVLFFLSIEMKKKIDNTSKIDDNNFGFDHCTIIRCDYVNNMHTHSYDWIPKTKKDSSKRLQSSLSMIMIITMVKNNQVHVCDNVLHMLDDGIYNTSRDVDYKPFHIIPESNYHDFASHKSNMLPGCAILNSKLFSTRSSSLTIPPSKR